MDFFNKLSTIRFGSISLSTILSALVVLIVCIIVSKIIRRIADKILGRTKIEKGVRGFLLTTIKVLLVFQTAIIVAECLGIPSASLIAILSVAGLALSLSLQGIMSNIFSGVTLLLTKPFVVDDFVEIGTLSGTVVKISLFYTTIKTVDNKIIYVPNSDAASARLVNYTHEDTRRVTLSFCVGYDNPTENVKAALIEAAGSVSTVLADPVPFASIQSYQDSTIEFTLWAWCTSADYWPTYYQLNETVRDVFEKHNITMSYSHLNVHIVEPKA